MSQERVAICRVMLIMILLSLVVFLPANMGTVFCAVRRYEGPMTDAHAHPSVYSSEWSSDWMVRTLEVYRQAGISRVIFFDGDEVLKAHRLKPNEIVPSLSLAGDAMNQASSIDYAESALKRGFLWLGEAILRPNVPADSPVALRIYDLCVKYQVPITIHHDSAYGELERVLERYPKCVFIFHAWGRGASRDTYLSTKELERLIATYPNLYVELGGQLENWPSPTQQVFIGGTVYDQFAYPDGSMKAEWRLLFEKYSSRIINGFDLCFQSLYTLESLKLRADYWRNLLGQISQESAEKIAYRNVEYLLARSRAPIRIADAEAAIQKAEREGRTVGLSQAKALIQQAKDAVAAGDYDKAILLADQAKELASKATAPQLTTSTIPTRMTSETTVVTTSRPSAPTDTFTAYVIIGLTIILVAVFLVTRHWNKTRRQSA